MITIRDDHAQMGNDLLSLHTAHLEAGGKSSHTIEARANVIGRLHAWLPFGLAYATTEQLDGWLATLIGMSRWTRAVYAYHIRAFYRWAVQAGFLTGDPTLTMARPRQPRLLPKPITEDELLRALQLPEPWHTIVLLAAFEGMRVSEIAACDRDHITPDQILIPDGKGGDPASVPTHPYVWEQLHDRPSGLLILNRHGRPVSGHWISVGARYHLNKIGMPGVHMHRLRHRYGTMIQQAVGDVRVTQECMRHRSVASTAGYTMVTGARRAAAVASLPVPDGGHEPGGIRLVPPNADGAA